jgi:predicted PurR-regulated permease PerM
VHPAVERLAAYSWRLLVIGAVGLAALWVLGRLWVICAAVVIALMLARVLSRPAEWLRSRGWPPALVAAVTLLLFLPLLAAIVVFVGVRVAGEADTLGPTVSQAVDDIESWLINDAPVDVSPQDLDAFRRDAGRAIGDTLRSSSGQLVSGAVVVLELIVSAIIGLILTFFLLKDGDRLVQWTQRQLPAARRDLARRLAGRAWQTLGGYLQGAAMLGIVEGVIIGVTLAIVGAQLAAPVGLLTFLLAFVPFVGAIVAGVVAALVALATAGTTAALIVVAVAVVVQQLDNDLLAPVVYGKALQIHPVVVLLAVTAGGALFGIAGSFLAVPVTAVTMNVVSEARQAREDPRNIPVNETGGSPCPP